MKVKIKDTTNKKAKKYIGEIRDFQIADNRLLLTREEDNHYIFTTTLELESENGNEIIIETKNSKYVLERVNEND